MKAYFPFVMDKPLDQEMISVGKSSVEQVVMVSHMQICRIQLPDLCRLVCLSVDNQVAKIRQ